MRSLARWGIATSKAHAPFEALVDLLAPASRGLVLFGLFALLQVRDQVMEGFGTAANRQASNCHVEQCPAP